MSTNLTVFQQNLPAHLRAAAADAARLNAGAANGTGGGVSINKLGIKGAKWRLIEGGDEVKVFEKNELDLVIVRANDHITKTYYAKPWKPGQEPEAPDCSSDDGIKPRADSKAKQCDNCAGCPHNQWGSYINPQTGSKGKKCTDSKRIAVCPPGRLEKGKLYQLQIPAASLKPFAALIGQLNSIEPPVPYNAVVVRFAFDTDQTFPKIKFEPADWLSEEQYAQAKARFDSQEAKETAGVPGASTAMGGLKPEQPAAEQQPQPQTTPAAKPAAQPAAQPADDADEWDEPEQTATAPAAKVAQPAAQADDDEWGDDEQTATAQPAQAAAAPARAPRKPRNPKPVEKPVTVDNETGAVDGAQGAGDADLDDVFGEGW